MASGLKGSEILKIAADIRAMVAEGKEICNLTVGDFSPSQFRIPKLLEHSIKEAITQGETNYPPSDGVGQLKKSVQQFYREWLNLDYSLDSIVITGGSRPGIYATYATFVDPGDVVVYPIPSWNNNHYCHVTRALARPVLCGPKTDFLPTRALLEEAVEGARLLSLNSPLNPTGTAFSRKVLEEICDLVLKENHRRKKSGKRPLYVMYDQVYWMLTFGSTKHVHPVGVRPEMAEYTIYVDGISKAFAATGVRVGWTIGPKDIVPQMSNLLGHVGAWAPRAEQIATAEFLNASSEVADYATAFKAGVHQRLDALHTGIAILGNEGFPVKAIAPMGAIYLSVQFALIGKQTPGGSTLTTNEDIRQYLLQEARVALVPFQAFDSHENTGWFRLSVGAVSVQEIQKMFRRLRSALAALSVQS
jgi:aspartate aminotransferase